MKSVFIVEDEEIEREALIKLINDRYKYRLRICGSADNGELAISRILLLKPDLIFLDIHLGDINGLEVASRIRNEGLNCSIVIVTAYSSFDYAQNAVRLQAVDYLLKPYSIRTLEEAINRVIDHDESSIADGITATNHTPIGRAKEFIRQFSTQDISLDVLSRESRLSKYQLSRRFNEETGMGIREFQHRCRIEIVESLLGDGMNIAEASFTAGYSDPNYFSRIVRKYTGKTASDLKRRN